MQLVERDTRHVRLTTAGEDVVARGRELLAAATDLAENARSATRPLSGPCTSAPSRPSRPSCCPTCFRPCAARTPS